MHLKSKIITTAYCPIFHRTFHKYGFQNRTTYTRYESWLTAHILHATDDDQSA